MSTREDRTGRTVPQVRAPVATAWWPMLARAMAEGRVTALTDGCTRGATTCVVSTPVHTDLVKHDGSPIEHIASLKKKAHRHKRASKAASVTGPDEFREEHCDKFREEHCQRTW